MTSLRIQVTITSLASTSDSLHGTVPTTLEQQIRMFFAENTRAAANFYNYVGDAMHSLSLHFTTGSDPTGFSVPFRFLGLGSGKQVAILAASTSKCSLGTQTPSENWLP